MVSEVRTIFGSAARLTSWIKIYRRLKEQDISQSPMEHDKTLFHLYALFSMSKAIHRVKLTRQAVGMTFPENLQDQLDFAAIGSLICVKLVSP